MVGIRRAGASVSKVFLDLVKFHSDIRDGRWQTKRAIDDAVCMHRDIEQAGADRAPLAGSQIVEPTLAAVRVGDVWKDRLRAC